MRKTFQVMAAFFASVSLLSAQEQPTILSISGQFGHGNPVVISGLNFGASTVVGRGYESTAIPNIYDLLEGKVDSSWNQNGGSTNDLTLVQNLNNRHQHSEWSVFIDFAESNTGDGYFRAPNDVSRKWYVRFWFRLAPGFQFGEGQYPSIDQLLSNVKFPVRFWSPADVQENFRIDLKGWINTACWATENVVDNQGATQQEYFLDDYIGRITSGQWHVVEIAFVDSSQNNVADASLEIWLNGESITSATGLVTRNNSGFKRPFIIGMSDSWGLGEGELPGKNDMLQIDDVYLNNSLQRVMIANAQLLASATKQEIQRPASWSENSITIDAYEGAIAESEELYAFVFGNDGVANRIGFPISRTILGDVNLDGVVNLLDVNPFIELLNSGGFQNEADINQDGIVNLLDVSLFIAILSGG